MSRLRRNFGVVNARGGQYGVTKFVHVAYLPLVPYAGFWVLDQGSGGGHETKLSGRSIVAGYLRTWCALAGSICMIAGGAAIAPGAACFAVAALAWSSRFAIGSRSRRRSDMNQLAFKTRCEPRHMHRDAAASTRAEVETRWAELSNGESPGDVARYGTDDPVRAAVAYGVLRMSALGLPAAQAAIAEAEADRILANVREMPSADSHPYREAVRIADPVAVVNRNIDARAAIEVVSGTGVTGDRSALSQRLFAAVRPLGFVAHPIDAELASLGVDQAWVRKTFASNRAVVHLTAPPSTKLGALSQQLRDSLGLQLGYERYRHPITIQLVWSGEDLRADVQELENSIDRANNNRCMIDSIVVADFANRSWTNVRTTDARDVADPVARCLPGD